MDLRQKAPFTIESIQVDGESEFMKEFKENCQEFNIPLFSMSTPDPEDCP